MNVVNETPFTFAPFMGKVVYPKDTLTLIVKGTFELMSDQPAQPMAPGDHLPPTGDLYYDDDPQSSCRYESDFVHFKPRADVCVVGRCHVPDGAESPACVVRFRAGSISKSLMVLGIRYWNRSKLGMRTMSEPEPFSSMEIRYENSFGGPDYAHNPIGKGIRSKNHGSERSRAEIPNLKVLVGEQLKTMQEHTPAGFGPLGRSWSQRMALAGTYGKKWQAERWPWLPEDFDWGYFNAAPPDQQIKGYLKGDEALYFENLHPEHSAFHTSLPGTRVRCFLSEQTNGGLRFREANTVLDTLWVDMDAQQLVLVWRGLATVTEAQCDQIEDLLIVQESVHEAARDLVYYEQILRERKAHIAAASAGEEESMEAPASAAGEPGARAEADAQAEAGLDAEIEQAMTLAHGHLDRSGLNANLVAALKTERAPEGFLEQLIQGLEIDPGAAQKAMALVRRKQQEMLARHRPEVEKLLVRQGWDSSTLEAYDRMFEEMPGGRESPSPSREALAAAAQSGEGVGDQDLSGIDFSGMSLEGANFKEAQLEGADFRQARLAGADFSAASLGNANFQGADLTDAKLSGADLSSSRFKEAVLCRADLSDAILVAAHLSGADFKDADLRRALLSQADLCKSILVSANLEQADLSGANLAQADLRNARMDFSVLDDADLTQSDLVQAQGNHASLIGSKLIQANFSLAVFEDANFSNCQCDFANFESARLNRATFEGAQGRKVNLRNAALEQLRAGEKVRLTESSFRRACGAGANWAGADLHGSDFILAVMPACDFSQSNLASCDCRTAELKQSVFDKACLKKSQFNRANLFQTRMEAADLTGTDFKGCNLYGTEFLNATIDNKTRFSGANLMGTKLENL